MKLRFAAALVLSCLSASALARDTVVLLPLADVIDESYSRGQLDGSVRFYLDGEHTPAVLDTLGEAVSNRKTNAVNKSDSEACRWVTLSALIALQEEARGRGANAVIGIVSWYKRRTYSDAEKVECHAGTIMSGITLRGTYAKVAAR
jgi:uncharacterized protein YbjQ (UPF0145 family)